jgi:hypothetical protein
MAAPPAIAVERFRVEHGEGFTMPVVSLTDRRAAGNRLVRFVFQRHLETVLYGRSDGSSGPIWKVMNAAGIGSTTMTINKAAVTAGTITEAEFKAIMDTFKSALPADVVDPCSLGREAKSGATERDVPRLAASDGGSSGVESDATDSDALSAQVAASDGDGSAAAERSEKSESCKSAAASSGDSCTSILGVLIVRGHVQCAISKLELWIVASSSLP